MTGGPPTMGGKIKLSTGLLLAHWQFKQYKRVWKTSWTYSRNRWALTKTRELIPGTPKTWGSRFSRCTSTPQSLNQVSGTPGNQWNPTTLIKRSFIVCQQASCSHIAGGNASCLGWAISPILISTLVTDWLDPLICQLALICSFTNMSYAALYHVSLCTTVVDKGCDILGIKLI